MPCYRPMPLSKKSKDFLVPCGQCIGCKLNRSQVWAARIMHEVQYQESLGNESTLALLTYDDEHLPHTDDRLPTLFPRDVQLFIKRLRREVEKHDKRIKFYAAGEYGDNFDRPHYHVAIMGIDFGDKVKDGLSKSGNQIYFSGRLNSLWTHGRTSLTDLNYESAGYIARYCTKKITGSPAKSHYQGRHPEFALQSTRPAIGKEWFDLFHHDLYTGDYLSVRGSRNKVPRYYDKLLERSDPELFEKIKGNRESRADIRIGLKGLPHLRNREIHKTKKIEFLKRSYENG